MTSTHPTPSVGIVPGWTPTAEQTETIEALLDTYGPVLPGSTGYDDAGNVYVDLGGCVNPSVAAMRAGKVWIDPEGFTWDR